MVKGKPLVRQGGRTLQGKIGNEDVEGLGTAATRNVGTASGNVMQVGAFGLGATEPPNVSVAAETPVGIYTDVKYPNPASPTAGTGLYYLSLGSGSYGGKMNFHPIANRVYYTHKPQPTSETDWVELHNTGNILTTTGQSTQFPMTQKAVTDAINARGFADASGILTVTSGALSNDMSSFLSQTTKDTMRSNLEVPQLNASATQQGGLKARLDGTTLYLTNDGSDA